MKEKNHFSKPNKKSEEPISFMRFSGLAFEMLAFILLGVWGGYKMDEYMENDAHVYTIVFSMLAIVGSIVYVIRKLPKQ